MTTRTSALLAASAMLGVATLIAGPASAGTGPGPNFDPYPQTYGYPYTPPRACSMWNRGGQIRHPNCGPDRDYYGYYYGEPTYYGGPAVGLTFDFDRHGYRRDRYDRWDY